MYEMGARLREIRLSRKMTQKELAKRINKSITAISSYETDQQVPPTDVLVSICKVLHTSITYFVDDDCASPYAVDGLTTMQKEVINLLFAELSKPHSRSKVLTPSQVEIIQKLVLIFQGEE